MTILNIEIVKKLMKDAISEAEKAAATGDVPVGALFVDDRGTVVARGHNTREALGIVHGHAEVNAINSLLEADKNTDFSSLSLVVTLEPCPMCMTAVADAGIRTVYYGAPNETNGACGTVWNIAHRNSVDVFGGFLAEECGKAVSDFFKFKRANSKA